jgi:KDO2-lipid IV(A) lauroyltransferase
MKSFKALNKSVRHTLLYWIAKIALAFIPKIPRAVGIPLFGFLGYVVFLVPNNEKRLTLKHLRFIFSNAWPEKKIRRTARSVYRTLGKNAFDAVKLRSVSNAAFNRIVRHDDLTEVRAAYDEGRGIFVLTAHIGCFEMLLQFFARHGIHCFAIGRTMFDPRIDDLVRALRSGPGIDYLHRDNSAREVIRFLKQGKAFGVLIDQDIRAEGVFVTFLGKPAFTVSGPVKTAMRMNIPVFVMTTARGTDNLHYVYISKRLAFADSGNFGNDLKHNIQMANDLIGATIMRFPEQWVWMHRRWRQQEKLPQ